MAHTSKSKPASVRLGVDVGGTFTDAALIVAGRMYTAKVPTTPGDQSEGVMSSVRIALEQAGLSATEVEQFAHGMTVTTNALLEQRGAATALIATAGFEDVIEIARQDRPSLYRLCEDRPKPLVDSRLRFGLRERITPRGPLERPGREQLAEVVEQVAASGARSVAICLLHSYADPAHEIEIEDALRARIPGIHVSRSSELLPVFREYERSSTTVIDAYLSPLLHDYLGRLDHEASAAGLPAAEIMQSNGGLMPSDEAARHAAWTVLSGPAAGAVAAATVALDAGERKALAFDMGGTSCDVALVDDGIVHQTAQRIIDGRPIQLPMVDVHTVGAGGGSIAWLDSGGALRVGPRSAGAAPGPACYGRGGELPTVTDANLALGYLGSGSPLAGDVRLDDGLARRALEVLARATGLDLEQTAEGVLRVADQEMIRALRVVTVERGVDPRDHALVAFGGAGPMHAARIAEQLQLTRVLCPPTAGVLSALGLAVAERRRDIARSVLLRDEQLTQTRVDQIVTELRAQALAQMPGARIELHCALRYVGQSFEIEIETSEHESLEDLRRSFETAHLERYGYRDPDSALELVNVRVGAVGNRTEDAHVVVPQPIVERESRPAWFAGGRVETGVFSGTPAQDQPIAGPAIFEQPQATIVVPPGWCAHGDARGTVVLERA